MEYDSRYIESDAFLMACESDTSTLLAHLRQFDPDELRRLRAASVFLGTTVTTALSQRGVE